MKDLGNLALGRRGWNRARGSRQVGAVCVAAAALSLGEACGAQPDAGYSRCPLATALYGGIADPAGAGLSEQTANAVGVLALDGAPERGHCTGSWIGQGAVLAAAHCVTDAPMRFRSAATQAARGEGMRVQRARPHPTLDLAVLTVEREASHAIAPLPVWSGGLGDDWIGAVLVIAGFGRTENGVSGELRFANSELVALDAEVLTLWGNSERGACTGDSGGPALLVLPDGSAALLGVLSRGSESCTGIDEYVRLEPALDWLVEQGAVLDDAPQADTDCALR